MLRISRSRRQVAPKTVGAGSRTAGCRRAIHDGRASLVDTEAMGPSRGSLLTGVR